MEPVASPRVIDASATLEPADRALLNMWVNQGLDDARIAALVGIDPVSLAARRDRIVRRLGARLGLPPSDVRAALAELAAASREADAGSGDAPAAEDRPGATAPPPGGGDAASTPPPPGEVGDASATPARRRIWTVIAAAAEITAVVVVIILVLGSGGGAHRTAASRGPAPGAISGERLERLPGVTTAIGGRVGLIETTGPAHPMLRLSVRVPTTPRGHFEAWLYTSILDSRSLGALPAGTHTVTYGLPRDARRYLWIDISFQPVGVVSHSGESRLRAPNPLRRSGRRRDPAPRAEVNRRRRAHQG